MYCFIWSGSVPFMERLVIVIYGEVMYCYLTLLLTVIYLYCGEIGYCYIWRGKLLLYMER